MGPNPAFSMQKVHVLEKITPKIALIPDKGAKTARSTFCIFYAKKYTGSKKRITVSGGGGD